MSPTPESIEVGFIAPRHLAGSGDPAWITVPLHQACGWTYEDDPLMPRVVLTSPDKTAVLRLEPHTDGQWWTLHHAPDGPRPAWYASFGAQTPVELIAGFMDALTALTPPDATDPFEPLLQQSWKTAPGAPGLMASDRTAFVQRPGDEHSPGSWFITATLGHDRPVWQARFGESTPPHLISAFTTALADPQPVWRANDVLGLPTIDPNIISHRFLDVPAAYVAAALTERTESLSGRHNTPPPNASFSGPAAPRVPRRR